MEREFKIKQVCMIVQVQNTGGEKLDIKEFTKVYEELNQLADLAMKRFIEANGYNWIFDWIDNLKEEEVLKMLTEEETKRYSHLKEAFYFLTNKIYQEE